MKQIAELQGHIIICGGGYIGKRVASEFYKNNTPFVVIEEDEAILRWTILYLHSDYVSKRIRQFRELDFETYDTTEEEAKEIAELAEETGVLYLQEDPTHNKTLIRAGIERAKGLIASMDDDKDNLFVVLTARQLAKRFGNDELRIIARVVDEENTSKLYAAGADQVSSPHVVGGFQMASNMLNPELGAFWNQMLYHHDGEVVRFMDLPIKEGASLVGQNIASLKNLVKIVVALRRDSDFQLAPDEQTILQAGDVLIVLGSPSVQLDRAVSA